MRLIDADALYSKLEEIKEMADSKWDMDYYLAVCEIINVIRETPTVVSEGSMRFANTGIKVYL